MGQVKDKIEKPPTFTRDDAPRPVMLNTPRKKPTLSKAAKAQAAKEGIKARARVKKTSTRAKTASKRKPVKRGGR